MAKRFYFMLGIIILFSACQQTGPIELTDAQRLEIADEIRQRNQEHIDLPKEITHDTFDRMKAFFVESNDPSWIDNPALFVNRLNIIKTKESYDETFRPTVDRYSSVVYTISEDYVAVLSPDHAVHVYKVKWSMTNKDGEITGEGPLTATTIWVRKNGEWKILHFHQSWTTD